MTIVRGRRPSSRTTPHPDTTESERSPEPEDGSPPGGGALRRLWPGHRRQPPPAIASGDEPQRDAYGLGGGRGRGRGDLAPALVTMAALDHALADGHRPRADLGRDPAGRQRRRLPLRHALRDRLRLARAVPPARDVARLLTAAGGRLPGPAAVPAPEQHRA